MNLLLTTLNAKYIHTNLAIRLLFELNRDWPGLAWREFTIHQDQEEAARFCAEFQVVAFSCYIWNITQTLALAVRIKVLNPSVQILLGGPEVSYEWEDVIARPEVDYIITGEGEIPFREFLYAWPEVGHLGNLVSKAPDGQVRYFSKPSMFNLEEYRDIRPWRGDDPKTLAPKVLYVETSRGCPYKCEFCLASLDNKVRYLPDEHIKANLLYLMENGRVIKFLDRTFNMKREFTLDIFRFILAHYRPGNVFQFEITADILHPDIVQFIEEYVPKGLFRFEIGIQTVHREVNLEVSRKQHWEKTKGVIRALEHKVEMHLDLIMGLPLERWDDIKYSFEEVFRMFAPELQMGFLKFLKGTPLREKYAQHGFVFDPEPPYEVIESQYLSREELAKLKLVEHALERYWNKPRATRSLRYVTLHYSIFDFLLGLGECFAAKHDFHQYTHQDAYERLLEYVQGHFPEDRILLQLIEIDYCMQQKSRPRLLHLEELAPEEKTGILAQIQENASGKTRFIAFPIDFDLELFEASGELKSGEYQVIFGFDGTKLPWHKCLSAEVLVSAV